VHPPGDQEFERSATQWLLSAVPPDYLLHGVLKRHPVALAMLARHHLRACVDGARSGYRTARSELGPFLPPGAVEAVLTAYRSEGMRLAGSLQAAELIERAFRGEEFVPQMSGGGRVRPGTPPRPPASADPSSGQPGAGQDVRGDRRRPAAQEQGRAAAGQQSAAPPEAGPPKAGSSRSPR
jgi:hypothetical protein